MIHYDGRNLVAYSSCRLPAIHFAAEDDRGCGLLHTFDTANLVKQLVQLLRRIAAQPGHVVELATHRAQLLHLPHGTQAPHHLLTGAWLDLDPDVGLQAAADQALAQAHAIAGNDLGFFQPGQARVDRGAAMPSWRARVATLSRALICSRAISWRSISSRVMARESGMASLYSGLASLASHRQAEQGQLRCCAAGVIAA